jgi:hypothetical protein
MSGKGRRDELNLVCSRLIWGGALLQVGVIAVPRLTTVS